MVPTLFILIKILTLFPFLNPPATFFPFLNPPGRDQMENSGEHVCEGLSEIHLLPSGLGRKILLERGGVGEGELTL